MGLCRAPSKSTVYALVATLLVSMPAAAYAAQPDDPWEPANRAFYALHEGLDHLFFGPAARAYQKLPQELRKGLHNLLANLKEPGIAFNDLIQAHPSRAGKTTVRFLVNSTAGIGGVMDIAYNLQLPHHDEL